jgi:hypothetical protein
MTDIGSMTLTAAFSIVWISVCATVGERRGWSIKKNTAIYCLTGLPTLVALHALVGG